MTLPTLPFTPSASGYSVQDRDALLSAELDGGTNRRRLDLVGVTSVVAVRWRLSSANYATLKTFYRDTLKHGVLPFTALLVLDLPTLVEYNCNFIPNTWRLDSLNGDTYGVSARMEVVPTAPDADADNTFMDVFDANAIPGISNNLLHLLDLLINTDLPAAIG